MTIDLGIICADCGNRYEIKHEWRPAYSLDFIITQTICGACGSDNIAVTFLARQIRAIFERS